MGDIPSTLHIKTDTQPATGEMTGKGGAGPMKDLKTDETTLSWSTKIDRPMPMKLSFLGEITGADITGTVKFGLFASGSFSGTLRS